MEECLVHQEAEERSKRIWCFHDTDVDFEAEYDEFVCKSQHTIILVQCATYLVTYLGFAVAGFVVGDKTSGYSPALDMTESAFCPSGSGVVNCSYNNDSTRSAAAAIYAFMYACQCALLVAVAVMVHREYYRRRWSTYSSILLFVAAALGPVTVNCYTAIYVLKANIAPIMNLTSNLTIGDARSVMLDSIVVAFNQRYSGITPLTLLVFAPRFGPFLGVCVVMFVIETIGDLFEMAEVRSIIVGNSR